MPKLQYVAIDVDDNAFHVAILSQDHDYIEFSCKPSASLLIARLKKYKLAHAEFKICYEATYLGFSLCRTLREHGFNCEVIASSLIPGLPGKKQKTDRLDTKKLVLFYMKGLLTVVHVPTIEMEMDRDLLRSRRFLVSQATAVKNHITSMCRRLGWHYKQEQEKKSYWTRHHLQWLSEKSRTCARGSAKVNIVILIRQLEQIQSNISLYDEEISQLAGQEKYCKKVEALNCYRGLDTFSSMTIIAELSDIRRFDHPRKLTSFAGLDLIEYSSGGKENKQSISRDGNKYLRTTVVEASQFALSMPKISKKMRLKRQNCDPKLVAIADRCMVRLHKKGSRMLYKSKNTNKIKVACAREMLGFIWESLKEVS